MEKQKPVLKLSGTDGNAFSILFRAKRVLEESGYSKEEVDEYIKEAQSGDYDNLLAVTYDWCDVQ